MMKKVVLKQQEEVSIDSITDQSIVGVYFPNSNTKRFLISVPEKFTAASELIQVELNWLWWANSKKEYAKQAIEEQDAEVFLFDTDEEVINWLKS